MNATNSQILFALAMLSLTAGCTAVYEGVGPSTPAVDLWSVQQRFRNYYLTPAMDPLQPDWSDTDPPR